MTQYDIWPTRQDIAGIDRLEKLVLEAGAREASDLEREVLTIGEIIDANAVRLGLARHLLRLLAFANRVGGELLAPGIRALHYPGGCWARGKDGVCPPFYRGTTGDRLTAELTPTHELQRAAMTRVFAVVIQNDARLWQGGETIVRFQKSKPEFATLHAGLADID